ncbi:MAG: hypothetical protein U0S12_07315 [Fimbriimonadales bacterium]
MNSASARATGIQAAEAKVYKPKEIVDLSSTFGVGKVRQARPR